MTREEIIRQLGEVDDLLDSVIKESDKAYYFLNQVPENKRSDNATYMINRLSLFNFYAKEVKQQMEIMLNA